MPTRQGFKVWELLVAVVVVGAGFILFIQAAERVREQGHLAVPTADMQDIVSACDQYHEQRGKWPTMPADLKPYMTRPAAYESLAEGWYLVIWRNLKEERPTDGPGPILIYSKYAAINGGFICYRDGTVERGNAEEVKAALEAEKK